MSEILKEKEKKEQAEKIAHLICEMSGKPESCKLCDGYKGRCFTLPKMKKLVENGYGKLPGSTKDESLSF